MRRGEDGYELIAGERRLRAAKLAGLREVPCLAVRSDEEESALLSLIENLQRQDLHYMEEAAAIAKLIAVYGLSQEQAAERLGKSQSAVANKLRLLRLSPACVALLRGGGRGVRAGGHGRGDPADHPHPAHGGCQNGVKIVTKSLLFFAKSMLYCNRLAVVYTAGY